MIDIVYHRSKHHVVVAGHAGAGKKGEDLICSAVTILVRTLAENVNRFDVCKIGATEIKLADGAADIKCLPKYSMKNIVTIVFDSVCAGFQLLATQYPEYVNYVVN